MLIAESALATASLAGADACHYRPPRTWMHMDGGNLLEQSDQVAKPDACAVGSPSAQRSRSSEIGTKVGLL
jgi:hypothetical protein